MSVPQPFACPPYALASCRLEALADADVPAIAATLAGLSPWRALGYTAEGLAGYLRRADPALYRFAITAATSGAISGATSGADVTAGVVCLRQPWLRGPYIELICVFPAGQGRGIGAEVVAWIAGAAGGGARNLWALVSAGNAGARRFYARCGFVEIAPIADLVRAGCDEILVRKPLA